MHARRFRIPLVLTWSALSSAMVNASGACSSATQQGGNSDSGSGAEAMVMDAPADSSPEDAQDAHSEGDEKEAAVAMDAAPAPPAECIVESHDATFTTFTADGATCPDGDIMV